MLRLSRNGIGVLTSQYKSVLRKCAILNMFAAGLFLYAPQASAATGVNIDSLATMGTEIGEDYDYDKLYVNGSGENNTKEMFSESDKRSWITNYKDVQIGFDTEGGDVKTTVSNKHSIPETESSSDMTPTQGGGVVSNQNYYEDEGGINGAHLRFGNTTFENNSVSDFATDSDFAVTAGGVVSNMSVESFGVNKSTFNGNYTMHFVNAEGGALYNGIIVDPNGRTIGTAMIESSENVFDGNHVGNVDLDIIPASIRSAWKNSPYYTARTNGIT
ncbi:MAG: hypothetical protein IKN71_03040, partial [Alphaproteobacteria bacterium]|nr:hypothetical protein [Alphaproteobacteria bacterium]